jgi:hypothetical protein
LQASLRKACLGKSGLVWQKAVLRLSSDAIEPRPMSNGHGDTARAPFVSRAGAVVLATRKDLLAVLAGMAVAAAARAMGF